MNIFSTDSAPYDYERQHIQGDKLLCDTLKALGFTQGVRIFERAKKYY